MSAIAGIYEFHNKPVSFDHSKAMMESLKKFPANDMQLWQKDEIFLGCLSQWITPESVQEQLPFYDYNRKLAITSDSIIDNRLALFALLNIDKSYHKDISDSQLILLAYEKWSVETPKYLRGDFAFMIWDEKNKRLFGARDFSGSRTLYYFRNFHSFSFCTLIEPLLNLPFVHKRINEQWLAEFLAVNRVIDTPDSSITPYENILQVPPSHSILVTSESIKLSRYNTFNFDKKIKYKSDIEYVEAFKEIFQEAVDSRTRSIKNVGAQLSGGLDSGAVASYAAKTLKKQNKTLHTFSYRPSKDFEDLTSTHYIADETPYIKCTQNYVGGLKSHFLDFKGQDPYSDIDNMLAIMEMPYKFFENSFWIKGMFESAANEQVNVLLNGDRGNFSISWGHAIDYYSILLKELKLSKLYKEIDQYKLNIGSGGRHCLNETIKTAFPFSQKIYKKQRWSLSFPQLINDEFAERTNVYQKLRRYGIDQEGKYITTSIFKERIRHFEDVSQWNASSTFSTKLSINFGVWKRDPTNDQEVIQFCLSVPENQYVQNGMDRSLIRRATKGFLPDEVRLNQRVRGIQGVDWVYRILPNWNDFKEELHELSKDKDALQYINEFTINNLMKNVLEGPNMKGATNPEYKVLMRGLIIYKFIKKFTERG